MKLALLIAAVDARIGGVMVFGDRGTVKSTAVRALAALLPDIAADRAGFQDGTPRKGKVPVPFVDLPLDATGDRVVGALALDARWGPGSLHRRRCSTRTSNAPSRGPLIQGSSDCSMSTRKAPLCPARSTHPHQRKAGLRLRLQNTSVTAASTDPTRSGPHRMLAPRAARPV